MDSSIPEDYSMLLDLYSNLKKDFEEAKQNLHDSMRQLKIKDHLILEYQAEIDVLQQCESDQNVKYELKITSLEETISNLRSNHATNIMCLESELQKKENECENLKTEMTDFKRSQIANEQPNVSLKYDELEELTNENVLLKEKCEQLQDAYEHLQLRNSETEELLQEYKREIGELKEMLGAKREELSEKSILIDKLNDDIFILRKELETYKNTPLQENSKGNSLFAEVDDRRIYLQKTVNDMKSNYMHLKQEHSKYEKTISHLRKENADLRAMWKKDLEQIQEDHETVVDSLNSRLRILEEINERQKQQLEEQPKPSSDDLCAEYRFYQDIIDAKSAEVKKLEKKLSDRAVTEHMLSVSLAQAHKDLRVLHLNILELRKQIDEDKAKELETKEADFYEKYALYDESLEEPDRSEETEDISERLNVKSCLRPIENIRRDNVDFDCKVDSDVSNIEEKRNKNVDIDDPNNKCFNITSNDGPLLEDPSLKNQENKVSDKRKGVKFSEAVVSPVSNPIRRRGTKIFFMNKKDKCNS